MLTDWSLRNGLKKRKKRKERQGPPWGEGLNCLLDLEAPMGSALWVFVPLTPSDPRALTHGLMGGARRASGSLATNLGSAGHQCRVLNLDGDWSQLVSEASPQMAVKVPCRPTSQLPVPCLPGLSTTRQTVLGREASPGWGWPPL